MGVTDQGTRYGSCEMRLLDTKLKCALEKSWNLSVPWFLCTSLLYYGQDESVISDALYDEMCKGMLLRWSTIKHRHKRYITEDMLRAGTGYSLKRLPSIVHGAAHQMHLEALDRGST